MPVPSLNVVIYARDLERALSFYASLGFAFDLERHGEGPEHYACPLGGGHVLEIYPWRKAPQIGGSIRLTLEIDALDATLDLLRPLALKIESTPSTDGSPRSARVLDPDGNNVLLIERLTVSVH